MKIIIKKENLPLNYSQILKNAGYHFLVDPMDNKESFSRRLGSSHYPRFHVYVKEENGRVIFDLHLDQKQGSHAGSHRHNAEYYGDLVEQEILRLKQYISSLVRQNGGISVNNEVKGDNVDERGTEEKIGHGSIEDVKDFRNNKKKSWWGRIFS